MFSVPTRKEAQLLMVRTLPACQICHENVEVKELLLHEDPICTKDVIQHEICYLKWGL